MQSAPFGAQCALHAGVTASFVCSRCGNFMCAGCAEGGAEAQCPRCRSLNANAFPFDAGADFNALWGHAFDAFRREAGMLIVATVVLVGFVMGGALVASTLGGIVTSLLGLAVNEKNPLANLGVFIGSMAVNQLFSTLVNMAVQGVAMVGYYRVLVDVLEGRRADIGRMFSQLHLFAQYVLMQVVLFFAVTVPTAVYFVAALLVAVRASGLGVESFGNAEALSRLVSPAVIGTLSLAMLAYAVFALLILPVTLFSIPELVVSGCGPLEALRRAWALGSGQRLRVFGYSFVAGLVVLAGIMLCCVGVLAATPLASLLLLALFLALRNSAQFPRS